MFERFPSLTRFSHGWTITEKLDGSNAQILIISVHDVPLLENGNELARIGDVSIWAGSRNRMITADKTGDHMGFAQFVKSNAEEIVCLLGEGRHFGEWVGPGIGKRHYDLKEKRFVLFNTHRWTNAELPERFDVVPVLGEGYMNDPNYAAESLMQSLKVKGSAYAPGFMNPEGVVMYHGPSKTTFKKTFDYDEQGKWAENQSRKS
jgi:hypothetical protein